MRCSAAAAALAAITLCFALAAPPAAGAPIEAGKPPKSPDSGRFFRLDFELWNTTGQGNWEISFAGLDPDLGFFSGRSRLDWRNIDSAVIVLGAEAGLSRSWALAGHLGRGRVADGDNTDSDWFTVPSRGWHDFKIFESMAETSGRTTTGDISLVWRPTAAVPGSPWSLDLSAGWQYYADELRDRRGVTVIDLGIPVREPIPGLNSTYDFRWRGWRLGMAAGLRAGTRLSFSAGYTLLFGLDYRGEAFWNLREDFRSTPPNFVHDAGGGRGYEATVGVAYRAGSNAVLTLGYRWLSLKVKNGTDVVYFADGTRGESSLDAVESSRRGFTFGAGFLF